jgi:integrase
MAISTDLERTFVKCVYIRKHPARKHGVKFDQQFILDYRLDGKRYRSVLGWTSEAIDQNTPKVKWTLAAAEQRLKEYKQNHRWNKANPDLPSRPVCMKDELHKEKIEALEKQQQIDLDKQRNISFNDYFNNKYVPHQESKGKSSLPRELSLFKNHLKPVVGNFKFDEIRPLHLEKIKKNMKNAEQSPASIKYAFALFRQIWNQALIDDVTTLANPSAKIKPPKINNARERFLTLDEEKQLLEDLALRSPITHDMAVMSLDTGARWGELAALTWQKIDLDAGTVRFMDTKAGDNRTGYLTSRVKAILETRRKEVKSSLVFPGTKSGKIQSEISKDFRNAVKKLGLNSGIIDRRQKITFHSLRHTCASRLVENGIDLYTVGKVLGHRTPGMTARYAHLGPNAVRDAVQTLEDNPKHTEKIDLKEPASATDD